MNTFTSTTTRQPVIVTAVEKVTGTNLLEAAYGGKVSFGKVRSSGTVRHWPVLAKGSDARKAAEAVEAECKSGTVSDVAAKRNQSVATVRRTLTALAFTRELEGLNKTERASIARLANESLAAAPKEQKAETKPATPKAEETKPAKPAKPAKESNADRLKRMKAEGKTAEKSTTES